VYRESADGTGTAERLTTHPNTLLPKTISPDGRRIVLLESAKTGNDLVMLTLDGKPHVASLIQSTASENNGDISPDGRWLAYESDESGRAEIYVRPFPAADAGRWQVSTVGGTVPVWARSGRELFYIDGNGFMTTVPVQTASTFAAGRPTELFEARFYSGTGKRYDVSLDSQRFVMVRVNATNPQTAAPISIVVVQNWTEELKRLVPTR
jgi:serine/threonine-protein kinase